MSYSELTVPAASVAMVKRYIESLGARSAECGDLSVNEYQGTLLVDGNATAVARIQGFLAGLAASDEAHAAAQARLESDEDCEPEARYGADAFDVSEGYIADALAEAVSKQTSEDGDTLRDGMQITVEVQGFDCVPLAVEGHGMRWLMIVAEDLRACNRDAIEATYRYVGAGRRR